MENPTSTTNQNSTWVNLRGSWSTNILFIALLRLSTAILPGISSETSWTLTNLIYNASTFIMFHWVTGIPFDLNQGEYEGLTLWEQIDNGEQFTPTKKFLTALPLALFLISTHYTHYDLTTFILNLVSVLIVLIAKLPAMHRVRIFGINQVYTD
ncbi:ORMDL family [Phlyctochytrium arcticum]|nr:ORMDL family [Phlyctochytrium arcticum]